MKKSVLQILDENYDFSQNKGNLSFSTDIVEMMFDKGEVRQGVFRIKNHGSAPMKGFVLSDNIRMKCDITSFSGDLVEIAYHFDSMGMEPGDVVKGEFQIISDKGEYFLPFEATMEPAYLYSSMGHIKNLFHFANLAKTNWEEAVQLFYSPLFMELLKDNDKQYRTLYRGLCTKPGSQQCVDEFLIGIKKKSRIHYEADKIKITERDIRESICRDVLVRKDGWGYVALAAYTDTSFLRLEKENFTDTDFIGNECRIPFYIEPEELHAGRNFGKIMITTTEGEIEVNVVVEQNVITKGENTTYVWKEQTSKVLREYIAFRLGKQDVTTWIEVSKAVVDKMSGDADQNTIAKLYQAQLLLAGGRSQDAAWILERVEEHMVSEKQYPEVYAYYLYLTTLLNREEEYINKVSQKVKKLFHKEQENPRLAWITLYLREDLFFHIEKKWEFLEECFDKGANSPLLYTEAWQLLKEMPSLMTKLESYEKCLICFAIRNDSLTKEMADRIQFLIGRERVFDRSWYNILVKCYEVSPSKEMLQAVCTYLMKGSCMGPEYFHWYEAAVNAQLKITRLYEFFIMSVATDDMRELPLIVMMYFAYQNNLDYERMAYLYTNVLKHRNEYPEVVASYTDHLEKFLRQQIDLGRINENLVYLYRYGIRSDMMDVKLANDYGSMLFMHEFIAPDPKYKYAALVQENCLGEETAPVKNGKAYLPVYGMKYKLFWIDGSGNRYADELEKSVPVLFDNGLLETMLPMIQGNCGPELYFCEGKRNYVSITEGNVYGFARLLHEEKITFTYKKEILVQLVKFYFDNDYIRELDELLLEVKPDILTAVERGEILHILVARGLYEIAYSWVKTFGVEHAEIKTILHLCSRLLHRKDFEPEEVLVGIASYLYRANKYDQNVLQYLVHNFDGSIRELRNLLRACESFTVDSYPLLEKTLVQLLFTGTYLGEKMKLYKEYMSNGGNALIEQCFLARCSFDYFVKESVTDPIIFTRIGTLLAEGETLNRVTRLAFLKNISGQDKETWNIPLCEELLTRELKNDVCFPFFTEFAEKIPSLLPLTDRTFAEYRGDAESRVIIHYAIEHDNGLETEYRKEEMDNLFAGIFVKSFLLFYGEEIQYYITEENGNREQLTQSSVLQKAEPGLNEREWRFSMLNEAVLGKEMGDYAACESLLLEYAKKDLVVREIFKYE